jgi:16S rRNA (cytosine967-C5)-methyltransferase
LYAMDVDEFRLKKMGPRVSRAGLTIVQPMLIDNENDARLRKLSGKFDRVLVDAPCTGLGTLRRNPDLKWRQTPQAVEELNAKQMSILIGAARLVKDGGRLVYATCSLLREENEAIVETFLKRGGFRLVPAASLLNIDGIEGELLSLNPVTHGCDGFFAAVLERIA